MFPISEYLDRWPSFVFIGTILYVVLLGVYRLYLSPTAKFPGPTLAALTFWYEFYYDVILGGQYTFHIKELHDKYGPIIRINPYELHVLDPDFYELLYASSTGGAKRNKFQWYTKQFGTPGSMFSTTDHDQHRVRRAALNRFFSMASVKKLQPLIDEKIASLVDRLRGFRDQGGKSLKLDLAFAAFTNDVTMEYSYGRCEDRLSHPSFAPDYHDVSVTAGKQAGLMKQMIWISTLLQSLPTWLVVKLAPDFEAVFRLQEGIENQIKYLKSQPQSSYQDISHPTIFHEILQSKLPESDKSTRRLRDEAIIVLGAGTLTTAWALSVACFHLLSNDQILNKLKTELKDLALTEDSDRAKGTPVHKLEQLPYLTAVIQEALRLSYGVSSRLQRISPSKSLHFKDKSSDKLWTIPPGTPVGMTSVLIHHDESIFPDSHEFQPERWLENPRLDHYLVSFSKGSRQCLGINLAYAEMYTALAAIFGRFGSTTPKGGKKGGGVRFETDEGVLQLWETGKDDVEMREDAFIPLAKEGSQGIRIKVIP
ncbi:hypothetical protein MMC25_005085 [Agyrium rufum]|nr:hypothetical protein [Agyrium rufum]